MLRTSIVPLAFAGALVASPAAARRGSNVARNDDTRPKECTATNSAGQTFQVRCPPGTVRR